MVKASPPVTMDMTLQAFCSSLDGVHGHDFGLYDQIIDYRRASDEITALGSGSSWRTGLHQQLQRAIDTDTHQWRMPNNITKRLICTQTTDYTRRALLAPRVKELRPALWEASREQRIALTLRGEVALFELPKYTGQPLLKTLAAMEEASRRLSKARARLDDVRPALGKAFQQISAESTWDGAPLQLLDGWIIGYSESMTFSATRCAQLCAQHNIDAEKLKTTQTISGHVSYRVVDVYPEDDDDGDYYAP